ncbi:MAG: DUF192 domain-containing protein [Candidatus Micrarchaeota archaeon]|nr:DUF192 domain-containing protein [Candidatus Micrarchaeota archaeon]
MENEKKSVAQASSASSQVQFELENASKKKKERIFFEIADTELARVRGLMFRKKIIPILFSFGKEGIYPIHSYFVKGEFDAVYVSLAGVATDIFLKIPKNTPLVRPKKKAAYLLELPVGIAERMEIAQGDIVHWRKIGR